MSQETEIGTQTFDSSSETIELRSSQETEMGSAKSETPDTELKSPQALTNARMKALPEKTPNNSEGSVAHASNATRKATKPSIAGQESGNMLRMIYPTRILVKNGLNEYKTNQR